MEPIQATLAFGSKTTTIVLQSSDTTAKLFETAASAFNLDAPNIIVRGKQLMSGVRIDESALAGHSMPRCLVLPTGTRVEDVLAHDDVTQLVLHFLRESGYHDTYVSLQREANVLYEQERFPAGELARALRGRSSASAGPAPPRPAAAPISFLPGDGKFAHMQTMCMRGVHQGNLTAVRWVGKSATALLTGGADKLVVLRRATTIADPHAAVADMASSVCLSAGVVSIDVHDEHALVGCMDGAVTLLRVRADGASLVLEETGEHGQWRSHTKYAHCVRWAPGGRGFATASFDKTVRVYRKAYRQAHGDEVAESGGEGQGLRFTEACQLRCVGVVEAIAWMRGGALLAVGVRGMPELQVFDMHAQLCLAGGSGDAAMTGTSGAPRPVMTWPLAPDNPHAQLTALALSVSPDDRWLAVSTDGGRLLVMDGATGCLVRTLTDGAGADDFSRPVHAWHRSSCYLYVTSDARPGGVDVWDLSSEAVVAELPGHAGSTVRDLAPHPFNATVLASCGYDKAVRLWGPHSTTVVDAE